jgi:hypothetical protein
MKTSKIKIKDRVSNKIGSMSEQRDGLRRYMLQLKTYSLTVSAREPLREDGRVRRKISETLNFGFLSFDH